MRTIASSIDAPTPAVAAITKATATTAAATIATAQQQRSPWHSPVPYLFGGLAAMLGLIAFALLILACSYWKLSGDHNNDDNNNNNGDRNGDGDVESGGEKGQEGDDAKAVKVYEEKILVIMAGDQKPTFLATPVCSIKASSFTDGEEMNKNNKEADKIETGEKVKEEVTDEESRQNQETQRDQEQNQ